MAETDTHDQVVVGRVLPRIESVRASPPYSVVVKWAEGDRKGREEVADLAPMILVYKLYKPLRENPELFKTVHVAAHGSAIAWGEDEAVDMSASAVEELAQQAMTRESFREFLQRHQLTYDAAAAKLGISRRLVAYYASGERPVPRLVALACKHLDSQVQQVPLEERVRAGSEKLALSPSA